MLSALLTIEGTTTAPQEIQGVEEWKKKKQIIPQILLELFGVTQRKLKRWERGVTALPISEKAFPEKVMSEPRLAGCVGVRWRSQDKGIPGEGNTMHIQRIGGVRVLFPAMLRSSVDNRGVAKDEAWRSNSYFSIPKALCS